MKFDIILDGAYKKSLSFHSITLNNEICLDLEYIAKCMRLWFNGTEECLQVNIIWNEYYEYPFFISPND